jgi:Protein CHLORORESPIRATORY REDUCTION 7
MTDYVLLETGQDERFLSDTELMNHLRPLVAKQEALEGEALEKMLHHLVDTTYELTFGPGQYVQWYETTLDQPTYLSRFRRS